MRKGCTVPLGCGKRTPCGKPSVHSWVGSDGTAHYLCVWHHDDAERFKAWLRKKRQDNA